MFTEEVCRGVLNGQGTRRRSQGVVQREEELVARFPDLPFGDVDERASDAHRTLLASGALEVRLRGLLHPSTLSRVHAKDSEFFVEHAGSLRIQGRRDR